MIIVIVFGILTLVCAFTAINMLDRINKKLKSGEYE